MKVLVTGADGFIGTKLVPALSDQGCHVVTHSIADGDLVRDSLPEWDVEHVIHLAARTFVPESWEQPLAFYETNLMGTAVILEFCRRHRASLTFLSTYVYGVPHQLPVNEEQRTKANTPYNHSKLLAEEVTCFYAEHFDVKAVVLRPFNIYGPGQRSVFLIPHIIRQVVNPGCGLIEVANLQPRRDFLFIDDLISAILLTLKPTVGGVFNIGSGQSYSVEEIIQTAQAVAGTAKPYRSTEQERPNEIADVVADIGKARRELGWWPRISLSDGLSFMIQSAQCGCEKKRL